MLEAEITCTDHQLNTLATAGSTRYLNGLEVGTGVAARVWLRGRW
jgi:hypothetical protein